ncbi:1,2-phenylacetyl-CoA epoxidase subunit PaaD [Jiangella rhizosphaerae]|uniref:Phenylacetate-CoA oxygenase subunit PaaJ n=1 Tax=Jiangella rhizosphaerae TaxID=2293569 RepID=A0A418KHG4_9ACTN|nr:1,2-phenylacetyl-CoA epoxidase subunit PaaD [Jiangella rhizosphaerae]RIQ11773.1 phenylacetate-CoA oxygenase subunit PaaJ [Jiangella rhizosphaerae]
MVTATLTAADVRAIVAAVPDPELPVVTIEQLGILRDVRVGDDGRVTVDITPTYSGCPAMDAIRADIVARLAEHGVDDVDVRLVLAPAWTTDWITPDGREALRAAGIAPPHPVGPVGLTLSVRCPHCGSPDTRELSRFGSTACKALWVCRACREPFDHVKAL